MREVPLCIEVLRSIRGFYDLLFLVFYFTLSMRVISINLRLEKFVEVAGSCFENFWKMVSSTVTICSSGGRNARIKVEDSAF